MHIGKIWLLISEETVWKSAEQDVREEHMSSIVNFDQYANSLIYKIELVNYCVCYWFPMRTHIYLHFKHLFHEAGNKQQW